MAFSSMSGSNTSSALFPLPTSHLHPIRKLYEYPSFDGPPLLPLSSNSKTSSPKDSSRPSSSTFYIPEGYDDLEARDRLEKLALQDKREKEKAVKSAPPVVIKSPAPPQQSVAFYPVSYIRGEWMQKLLELELGKRKIRYFLSDETLCLGTPLAPITSEYSSGLSFYEAYTHTSNPEAACVYMSEEQVIWLVDELYSSLGAKNSKLTYEDVNIDTTRKISLKEFKAIRKISFRNNVAGFRRKCRIPIFTKAATSAQQKTINGPSTASVRIKQNWANGALPPKQAVSTPDVSDNKRDSALQTLERTFPNSATTAAQCALPVKDSSPIDGPPSTTENGESVSTTNPPPGTVSTPAAPKSFASLTKAERQARLQARRDEELRKHLEQQRISLPSHRKFYRNLEKYGGAALACDVESWTEDAEVLLELGMAWFVWSPSDQDEGVMERDGGSCHYIIEETIQYRNEEIEATRWDYSLGESETLPQNKVPEKLRRKIDELSVHGPLVLVFHDASAETRYFQKLGIDPDIFLRSPPPELSRSSPIWPSPTSDPAKSSSQMIIIQDTQNLYAGWSKPQIKQINLGKACTTFGLHDEATKLHNAGNDAFAILRVWEILLEMDESERQSEGGVASAAHMPRPREKMPENVQTIQAKVKRGDVEREPAPQFSVLQTASEFPDLIELW